jgi:Flp pilus assembly protein TadD
MRTTGKPYAALANLDEFDRRYGHDDEVDALRGDCLVDIGEYAKADAVYHKLLQGAAAGQAYRGLGRSAGQRGDWAAAVGSFSEAVRREPAAADRLNDLGYALLKSGDAPAAVFRLRQAHDLAPADVTVFNNLILALSAAGSRPEAHALLEKLDPAARLRIAAVLAAQEAAAAR